MLGGCLALGCSLGLDCTYLSLAATAATAICTAVWATATAGLAVAYATAPAGLAVAYATVTAGLAAQYGVQQLNSRGLTCRR